MTASASGTTSSGLLPASLAALLNAPPSPLAPQAPQFFGTTAVGSMYSAPPPPPSTVAAATLLAASSAASTASLGAATAGTSATAGSPATALPTLDTGVATTALSVVPTASGGSAASASPGMQPPPPMPAPLAPAPAVAPPVYATAAPGSAAVPAAPFHFANQITIRLTPDNYLFWRAKVLPLLRSHELLGYVDGSLPCPPQVIMTVQGPAINPDHRVWVQQDQTILSAIQGSLGEGVAGLVLFAATSRDAWTTLEHAFANVSTSRTMALRRQLGEIKKLDSSASTYFNKIKVVADTLASLGQPLRDEEFACFIIQGLDSDYDNLAEAVNGATTPLPPHELYSRLMFTEQRVEARRAAGVITDQSAAHWANRGQRPPAPPGAGSAPPPAAKPAPPPAPTTGGGRAGDTRVCQLCGRPGHLASKCHRRFQRSFLGIGNNGQGNERQAQLADFGPPPAAPAAFAATKGKEHVQGSTPSYPIDPAWYMDTGATDHLTSELQKLTTHQPYYGTDKVHTANGAVHFTKATSAFMYRPIVSTYHEMLYWSRSTPGASSRLRCFPGAARRSGHACACPGSRARHGAIAPWCFLTWHAYGVRAHGLARVAAGPPRLPIARAVLAWAWALVALDAASGGDSPCFAQVRPAFVAAHYAWVGRACLAVAFISSVSTIGSTASTRTCCLATSYAQSQWHCLP
ncbi:hypothetical protein QYE76_025894 [Lolium multiflorum]|uniref:CCHC-type domain-containing protein n=1 Tax=Lolium multiflorum TaxID=4521 RepID=A0AAD8RGA2_LOLMU|nr:hypothetical protein QYE76_025894 [Lolium multiflorum]